MFSLNIFFFLHVSRVITSLLQSDDIVEPVRSPYEITEVQSTDGGWYTCICENPEGNLSQSVYLDVYSKSLYTVQCKEWNFKYIRNNFRRNKNLP